jgi:hypothetical protein
MKLLANVFGGNKSRITYTYPVPRNLVDWSSRPVFEAMVHWAERLGKEKSVQDFVRTASDEAKSLW